MRRWEWKKVAPFTYFSTQQFFILTRSADIPHLEYLIKAFPDAQFSIVAYTNMAPSLRNLASYDNVYLCPEVPEWRVVELLASCTVYLDINRHEEAGNILERAQKANKAIVAFDDTQHGEKGQGSFLVTHQLPWWSISRIFWQKTKTSYVFWRISDE